MPRASLPPRFVVTKPVAQLAAAQRSVQVEIASATEGLLHIDQLESSGTIEVNVAGDGTVTFDTVIP